MQRTHYLILGSLLLIIALALIVYQAPSFGTPEIVIEEPEPTTRSYSNEAYGLSFTYPLNYELSERRASGSGERQHEVITLMRKEDLPPPVGGEGPPAITIEVFQNNLDHLSTEEWIRNNSLSNFKMGDGTLSSTTISTFPALSYRWSGLYEGTSIVTAQPRWVYMLSVTYLEMGAPIVQDFVQIRDSVMLTPVSAN